jgi:hypothetical protein
MALTRSSVVILVVGIAAALVGQQQFGTHHVPAGQPPLVHLDAGSLETLRDDFNAAQDSVRVIVLLSPT